jgi:hypothetical protein
LLLQNKYFTKKQYLFLQVLLFSFFSEVYSQVNHVGNPSFENYYSCGSPNYISRAKYWNSIDSTKLGYGGKYFNVCYPNIPFDGVLRYQYPRTGKAFIGATQYCTTTTCAPPVLRQYPKNRLINPLVSGQVYCVKMYVNITNPSPYGNDAMQMYFGDSSVDTISQCGMPLTFLTAQVKNPVGNIIIDTLNWIEVSGTYTATGNEKYLILGNFVPDGSVNSSFINGSQPGVWTDVGYDDISVIPINLSAYAGPDKNIFLGDSAFIGRPPEIGLECTWSTGTLTVGDSAGIWVKPTAPGTYSYVVTQNICGNIKTDTVNVVVSPSSINENAFFANSISIYPQPAKDLVFISLNYFYEPSVSIKIIDVNGREILNKDFQVSNHKAVVSTESLSNGVYILQLISKNQIAQKRLIISK